MLFGIGYNLMGVLHSETTREGELTLSPHCMRNT
jgi:hypothetical protein